MVSLYADTVAELAGGPAEADVVLSKVEGDGEAGDAAMRVTEQAGVDTELDIEGATDTGGRPTTPTGDAHLCTIQLLDRDDIRELVHEGISVIDRYSRRIAIENSYMSIKDFLAWTTPKDYYIRLFHFAFAVLLYDIWLLTDLLVKALGCEQYALRLNAMRFLILLDGCIVPVG